MNMSWLFSLSSRGNKRFELLRCEPSSEDGCWCAHHSVQKRNMTLLVGAIWSSLAAGDDMVRVSKCVRSLCADDSML